MCCITSVYAWTDIILRAVSINQEFPEERDHQVGMMSMIYAKAERVVVWLGSQRSAKMQKAMTFIRQMSNKRIVSKGHICPLWLGQTSS